jgi:gluconokinase
VGDHRAVVLGVDLGTSATKVVAAGRDLRPYAVVELPNELNTSGGRAVQDPEAVLATALRAIRRCVRACAEGERPIAGIAFSAALHTLLATDASGNPLTPALSWADQRAAEQARRLLAEGGHALHRATGTPVHPMAPLAKLAWYAEHDPALLSRAAHWCGLKDFVLARLTGRMATDHSCASATGLLDAETLSWHRPALAAAGVHEEQLPELVAPTDLLSLRSDAAHALGVPAGLPVVAGAGDGPLANLAAGAMAPGVAALSLGTSGALRVVRDRFGVDPDHRTFCYYLADGYWTLGGAVSNGGSVAQWAANVFGVPVADLLAEAATAPAGADGLIALPYLLGERAPWWDPDLRGALIGLRHDHGRAAITRALVEGVAQQLALVRDSMLAAGATVDTIRATGGALRAPLWTDALAAALDTPIQVVDDNAGSGLGAAALGWRALGAGPLTDLPPRRPTRPHPPP